MKLTENILHNFQVLILETGPIDHWINRSELWKSPTNLSLCSIPWRRAQQSPAVYLPGESPWTEEAGGPQSKESDMTEAT